MTKCALGTLKAEETEQAIHSLASTVETEKTCFVSEQNKLAALHSSAKTKCSAKFKDEWLSELVEIELPTQQETD